MSEDKKLLENLFVLELANNHWGSLERGLDIVSQFSKVVRYNNIKAAIKLQFRDVDSFIHPKHKDHESRYIQKTLATKLSKKEFETLIAAIKDSGCLPMATPFDEKSVDFCGELELPVIKIASSDIADWPLMERVAQLEKPVMISNGGASEKDTDDVVKFFKNRNIELGINHCVSLYPSEDFELELNQIDYLKNRYPDHIIGLSSHEYHDWFSSMLISYGKGARTWERHIDIEYPEGDKRSVSKYCSLPDQVDTWFKAFKKAEEMCGSSSKDSKRVITDKEIKYLDELVRGVYAKHDLSEGYTFNKESFDKDFFMSIPLQKGQLSCREILNGEKLTKDIKASDPLMINDIDHPYEKDSDFVNKIKDRGL